MNLEEKFNEYHRDNPKVWVEFKRYAMRAVEAAERKDKTYISADMIMHALRWNTWVGDYEDEYRINNNWVAYYSRMFQKEYPQYSHYFRNRKTTTEKEAVL